MGVRRIMKLTGFAVALFVVFSVSVGSALADINLGTASTYAVLATTTVTNPTTFADTVITGNMGAVSCTGFVMGTGCSAGPGMVNDGSVNLAPADLGALADSNAAYLALEGASSTGGFTCLGTDGGCLNDVAPGVYTSTLSSTLLDGALTLNGGSTLDPVWIFQMAFGFTTGVDSSVLVIGADAADASVYFEVGSQATLGDDTVFQGNILAGTEVAFDPGAQITCGRAFTDTAAGTQVTFAGNNPAASGGMPNVVSDTCAESASGFNGPGGGSVPEPSSLVLLSSVLLGMAFLRFRRSA